MKNPKLIIQYSYPYDELIYNLSKRKFGKNHIKKGFNYSKRLQKEWNKLENKIFKSISKFSGLKWKKLIIDCYIVTKLVIPFSIPLTLYSDKDIKNQIQILIHELIHNILIQNYNKFKKTTKYDKYNWNIKLHILVHAIQKEVCLELFGKKKTKEVINTYHKYPDYKKAWDIVEKDGSKNIIKEYIK